MSVRVVANADKKITFSDGTKSSMRFHPSPDGAAIFPLGDGYVYVSNSERNQMQGGVYGVYFDSDGKYLKPSSACSGYLMIRTSSIIPVFAGSK